MSHEVARSAVKAALHRLSLAGVVILSLSLPAIWLAWEANCGQQEASLRVQTAANQARSGLQDLLTRFDRATAGLRAQDVQGDTTSLTARLLRADPLVTPASGLLVINARGLQVASSEPDTASTTTPAWFLRALTILHSREVAILSASATSDAADWMIVRRIEDAKGSTVALVASTLPNEALRTLVTPADNTADTIDLALGDGDSRELRQERATLHASVETSQLVKLYRTLLPERWLTPNAVGATWTVGNLTWVGSVTPSAALGLRAVEIDGHAKIVMTIAATFIGLAVLLGFVSGTRETKRTGTIVAATVDWRATTEVANREVAELRRKLDDMVGERDRVLAAIGHDVRTPINSILGICALLMDGDLDDAQRKWLRHIRASCEALLAMLNGMLEIAAAHVDGAEIHREAVDVTRLLEEVGEVLRPQAHDKGLELQVAVEESVLGIWETDPTRLRQVLFNLAGNAVKYTMHGSVEIRALACNDRGGREMLRFRVTDTGPGIAADEKEVIFEQFRRGRQEVSGGQEGLGLGLALCREIATLLGGTLSVESTHSVGSVFTFEIPVERVQTSGVHGIPLTGRTALVVGLSEGLRRRIASHLENIGFDVETAADGFVALGLAERTAHQHGTLDLIIFDAALAWLSADALLVRLRANRLFERTRTVLVANGPVAISAEGQADAIVPHPVEASDLDRVVTGFFGTVSPLQEIHPRAPAAPKGRILVVEDNRVNQALFLDVLNRAGFSAFAASSGEEAVQAAARGGFDAILMDVQMPGIDGTEATRRIRAGEGQHRVPIIGLTAHSGAMVRKRCLDAGMESVLHKPVNLSSLPIRLHEIIAKGRLAAIAEDSDIVGPPVSEDISLDIADEYLQVLIAEFGVIRTRACIMEFLSNTASQVPTLLQLQSAEDWKALGDLAHSVAGVAGTLGAVSLADGLLMLEDAARIEEKKRVADALRDVQMTWSRTRPMLRCRFEALARQGRDFLANKTA